MADIQPSETSTTTSALIGDSNLIGSGGQSRGGGEEVQKGECGSESGVHADATRPGHVVPNAGPNATKENGGNADQTASRGVDSSVRVSQINTNDENAASSSSGTVPTQATLSRHPSSDPLGQPQTQPPTSHSHPAPPMKRFTSVNINKRFLEKTSSAPGTPLGGSPLAGHVSNVANASGSGQGRGASPSSRSPSIDRPAPSRLVTAKLTAVPQPIAASTSGWLRSSTPGTNGTPTPPSSSPQPALNGASVTHPQVPSSGPQPSNLNRRVGEPPSQNGAPLPASSQTTSKPVWGKVPQPPAPSNPALEHRKGADKQIQIEFPTAAEAAHGRKTKAHSAQLAAETAAAQLAAQKQAMSETAAAFRGAHLDPNTHHWDEMEDEDSDFLAGVIEFGDGRQYKIENKVEVAPAHEAVHSPDSPDTSSSRALPEQPRLNSLVTKEERFGEDIGRSWPRARTSPIQSTASNLQRAPSQHDGAHMSPTDGSASGSALSPQDGISPTSRVLFNERSNRLEPWSSIKPRSGSSQPPGPIGRRNSRGDHLPFNLQQQSLSQAQGRDAPSHPHSSAANVQLLQKGQSGSESVWKGGPPRGFNHGPDRGRWGAPSPREEERPPWEVRRRESMSSSDAAGSSLRERSRDRSRWDTSTMPPVRDEDRGRRNSNMGPPPSRAPVLPPALARDRSRDVGRQQPPHLSRMPPPPVPPTRGASTGEQLPPTGRPPPPESSPISVQSVISPSSEQAPPITSIPTADEDVDKDTLVKDAMQLALERAKRRKQEGEAEEKRRLEAAERARKKAEAIAAAQEEKKRAENPTPPPPLRQEQKAITELEAHVPPKLNGVDETSKLREQIYSKDKGSGTESLKTAFRLPPPSALATSALPPSGLPRKPTVQSLPAHATPASQADSWRSKVTPMPSSPPHLPQPSSPPTKLRGILPPSTSLPEFDLSVKPDENIEIVDFSDHGKLIGHPTSSARFLASTEVPSKLNSSRLNGNDPIDSSPMPPREQLSTKTDNISWRRLPAKPMIASPPLSSGEELGTQSVPIFTADEQMSAKDTEPSSQESKHSSAPPGSPSSRRLSAQGDQIPLITSTQSNHAPSAATSLRSPRNQSYFKEAPMSTLTDTMSRIKGALDGMQLQDFSTAQSKEAKEMEHLMPAKPKGAEGLCREPRAEIKTQVTKVLTIRPAPREIFDITRPEPPRSPKPAWRAFLVRLPKESRSRDPISRKQLHFWNLPHPGVRWDILSWEPPVEGMNKRELSRDEIFHRKNGVKGGRLRVVLPNKIIVHSSVVEAESSREVVSAVPQPTLVTAAGVKIKLPSGPSLGQSSTETPKVTLSERPRDTGVPSWRRSAMPLAPVKKEPPVATSTNDSVPDHGLNTISRSPPPEPSTPLPQFTKLKSGLTPPLAATCPATVSLPTIPLPNTRPSAPKRAPVADVAFFRTSRVESEAETRKPLPRFTVISELDSVAPSPSSGDQSTNNASTEPPPQPSIHSLKGSPNKEKSPSPHLAASKSESKNSDETAATIIPTTPPSTHTSSAWGKSPLSFSVKDSPARSAPDPEHLKAVWSQPSGRTITTTSNSLKEIADDLPSIPFTVQEMKSEDGETPPPTAPAPAPSRLSLQEVTRAFQQVPGAPAPVVSPSRPTPYSQTPLLSSGSSNSLRSNQPAGMGLPAQHTVHPGFAPYPPPMVGHSPSPTLMFAPGIPSPVAHHRMAVNGPSPPVAHGIWLPTPPPHPAPSQPGSFIRPAGSLSHAPMMYPSPAPIASPGAPGQMMHRRLSVVSPPVAPPPSGQNVYAGHPVDMQAHIHSPHHAHTHPIGHPVPHIPVGHIFSPPQPGQTPMYAIPVGAGRGGMMPPRPGYESMPQMPPHNAGYQPVPATSFVHPFRS